ncbi:MAG: DUF4139 domain-containing protein [Candidatus Marinimicrobia bacterium]|nr:DUF4139 domain-containing protein [Candidatus Neomarinimicrobiota bacterium]
MKKKYRSVVLLMAVVFYLPCLADNDFKNTQVTIYNNNQGLIYQGKEITLAKGLNTVRIEDISAKLRPATVKLRFPKVRAKVEVLEQNFLYDLVNTWKLFSKYTGENITFRLNTKESISGKLLSADQNHIVVQMPDGSIRIARAENIADYEFPSLPGGLIVKPTLEWNVQSEYKGKTGAEISYLTTGMSWNAEYILVLDQKEQNFTLSSWISLNNNSGATYENAKLKLIAGGLHRVSDANMRAYGAPEEAKTMAARQAVETREIADYYLYELPQLVTLRDQEMKQVSLFDEINGKGRKVYLFKNQYLREREDPLEVVFRLENTKENNMGMALPKGVVRVFKRDVDETLQFIGEDRIDHTSNKDTLRLTMGRAFDVKGKRTIIERERSSKRSETVTVEIQITNRKTTPAEVEIIDDIYDYGEIKKASHSYNRISSRKVLFPITVKADATETITYTFFRKW